MSTDTLRENKNTELPDTELPKGFSASGFYGGVKKAGKDMALLYSEVQAEAAGVFTLNRVRADCVEHNKTLIERGEKIRAILANSGNANACTGSRGAEDSRVLAKAVSELLSVDEREVLLASTGVIGVPLPIESMKKALEDPSHMPQAGGLKDAATAIMTTDTVPKIASATYPVEEQTEEEQTEGAATQVRLTGIAKGSGMIHPNMATMLGFVVTDADVSREALQEAARRSADLSFNMISVDGDTSTNDMLLLLANGLSGSPRIESLDTPGGTRFFEALCEVTRELAKMIVRDGEGATKFLEVHVSGAETEREARSLAKAIIGSNLVKTAFFGEDANWGRIMAAMGSSGVEFDPLSVSISFRSGAGEIALMDSGTPVEFDEEDAAGVLSRKDILVEVSLKEGRWEARAWGCDLSYEYVKINGDYRT
ncbi:MAG: bifunctional glutamate N-acetyltransferase/amino-acid acetyltransferase ArgJ [Spirochaetaceae bacterium]